MGERASQPLPARDLGQPVERWCANIVLSPELTSKARAQVVNHHYDIRRKAPTVLGMCRLKAEAFSTPQDEFRWSKVPRSPPRLIQDLASSRMALA